MLNVHFLRGGVSEKVYVLYTHLNVGNYGWPLSEKYAQGFLGCSVRAVVWFEHPAE